MSSHNYINQKLNNLSEKQNFLLEITILLSKNYFSYTLLFRQRVEINYKTYTAGMQ